MYLEFYGLKEAPFSITPDPRYVFLSERHRDALAHLLYGIGKGGSGGFVQLTGEVGTGKTTLCRLLLEQLPENTRVALVLNPKLSPIELLETIGEELKLDISAVKGSLKGLVDTLNAYLLDAYAQGLRVVLIVDEAQNLSADALEQVRLLTNLETPTQKLLQIILLGQPELRDELGRPELRQLAQRITARYHLTPLARDETEAYVRHRLAVAGCPRNPFSRLGLRALYRRSQGIPRLINVIADRALMAGYAREQTTLGESLVDRAAAGSRGSRRADSREDRAQPRRRSRCVDATIVAMAGQFVADFGARRGEMPERAYRGTRLPARIRHHRAARSVRPAVDFVAASRRFACGSRVARCQCERRAAGYRRLGEECRQGWDARILVRRVHGGVGVARQRACRAACGRRGAG